MRLLANKSFVKSTTTSILLGTTTLNFALGRACQFSSSSSDQISNSLFSSNSCPIQINVQKLPLLPQRQQPQQIRTMFSKPNKPDGANLPKGKSQEEWRTVLSPEQFKILREQGTERAFTHEYENKSSEGVYNCAACETPLYKSTTKFKSGCGWPAFFDAIPGAVKRNVDKSLGMKRIEIRCSACDSHLGHVFEGEGFNTPTDERHCVNGISLRFNDEKEKI